MVGFTKDARYLEPVLLPVFGADNKFLGPTGTKNLIRPGTGESKPGYGVKFKFTTCRTAHGDNAFRGNEHGNYPLMYFTSPQPRKFLFFLLWRKGQTKTTHPMDTWSWPLSGNAGSFTGNDFFRQIS